VVHSLFLSLCEVVWVFVLGFGEFFGLEGIFSVFKKVVTSCCGLSKRFVR